jgi:hypothetical protein
MGRIHAVVGALLVAAAAVVPAAAQSSDTERDQQALRQQIERRFDVLPVQDGVVLRPKRPIRGTQSIELKAGTIAIDGDVVTGRELRDRLGSDADAVLRLSYMNGADQQALFGVQSAERPRASEPPAGAAEPPLPPLPPRPRPFRERHGGNDRVRIGGGVEVRSDEMVNGDVVAIGGPASIDGPVRGDVVAVGGGADLGPHADVGGDVTVVGGTVTRDPAAKVGGSVNEVPLGLGALRFWRGRRSPVSIGVERGGPLFASFATISRLAFVFVVAAVVLFFGRAYVERVGVRAAEEPVKAGLIGLLIQLMLIPLFLLTIVVLIVTIIGIPLLVLVPFALVALAILWVIGFTAVAGDVGRFIASRFGWQEQNPYLLVALGILAVLSPALVASVLGFGGPVFGALAASLLFLGFCLEYIVWTVGLGAVALLRFGSR